jgi:hypothetical protein
MNLGLYAHQTLQLSLHLRDLAGSSLQVLELPVMLPLKPVNFASRHGARKLCFQQGDTCNNTCKGKYRAMRSKNGT